MHYVYKDEKLFHVALTSDSSFLCPLQNHQMILTTAGTHEHCRFR